MSRSNNETPGWLSSLRRGKHRRRNGAGPGGGSGNREGQRWDTGPGCPIHPSRPGLANRNFRNRRIRMTWFRLLLGHWVYHWHWAYSETELNHFERMKLTPSCGNEVATISNWAKGKFLAHRSLLGILAPLAALIAVLVWYFPLWQLSFNPSTQVDDEGPRGFYPTKEEMQADAEILRASGIVEQINGGQEWEPVHRVSGYTGQRGTRRLAVEAKWAAPVAHSGPWSWTACDEPRKVVTHQRYSNITLLEQGSRRNY